MLGVNSLWVVWIFTKQSIGNLQSFQSTLTLNQEITLLKIEVLDVQETAIQKVRCMMLLVGNVELYVKFLLGQHKEDLFFVGIVLEKQNLEMIDVLHQVGTPKENHEEVQEKKIVMFLLEKKKDTLKVALKHFMQL